MIAPAPVINLDDWAVGDGVADDTGVMQASFIAAGAWPGESIIMLGTGKTYLTTSTIHLTGSNVTVSGSGTWKSRPISGIGLNFEGQDDANAAQPISPASKAATSITTTAAADLTPGDYVLVYTGQDHNFDPAIFPFPLGVPSAEMNLVSSVAGSTVGLTWPLAKAYAQEYWIDASGGLGDVTTTTPSAYPAPLAVRKIHPFVGLTIDGITIDHQGTNGFLTGHQYVDLQIANVTATAGGYFMSISAWTGAMTNCSIHCTTAPGHWWVSAYGARDVSAVNCTFTADVVGYMHIHEGSANVAVTNVTCTSAAGVAASGDGLSVIGLRGRGHDIVLTNVTVTNARTGEAGIEIDVGVTGSTTGYTFSGTGTASSNNSGGTFTIA